MKRWLIPVQFFGKPLSPAQINTCGTKVFWKLITAVALVSTIALLLLFTLLPDDRSEAQPLVALETEPQRATLQILLPIPQPHPQIDQKERRSLQTVTPQPSPAATRQRTEAPLIELPAPMAPSIDAHHDKPAIPLASTVAAPPLAPSSLELTLAALINRQRQRHGLAPLTIIPALNLSATQHSVDMSSQAVPWHAGSDGSNGGMRMQAAGYNWERWAEVIGWGFPEPDGMVDWWLNDEAHRVILLSSAFTEIGVGHISTGNTPWQDYWTVNFGRPLPTTVASIPRAVPAPATPADQPVAHQEAAQPPVMSSTPCPTHSQRVYRLIPMENVDRSHPAPLHADLNLQQRGYTPVAASPELVDIAGPVDPDAPQLFTLFADSQAFQVTALYQVYDWNWQCGEHGCRGTLLGAPEATAIGLATRPGALLRTPTRQARIYGDTYVAAVLYAETTRLTLAYTRDGSVANGYAVHIDQVCVDPNLVQLYQEADRKGRQQLPGLQHNQIFGAALDTEVRLAIRDRGTFLDPRSRKDWWRGF